MRHTTARKLRAGIEIELLAPAGCSRLELAELIARRSDTSVVAGWHLDSETSAHQNHRFFHHMTPAFDVTTSAGTPIARLVDDITVQADLDHSAHSAPTWRRVVGDDPRILRMLTSSLAPIGAGMENVAVLAEGFGLVAEAKDEAIRLADSSGASVALVAGMPGERERVCELISPPLRSGLGEWVESTVGAASELGFTVPREAAIHLHYDADLFRSKANVERLLWAFGDSLSEIRASFGTNEHCRRIGPLPSGLVSAIEDLPENAAWADVAAALRAVDGITKYADVNITQLIAEQPTLPTVEFRFLPGSASVGDILDLVARSDEIVAHLTADP